MHLCIADKRCFPLFWMCFLIFLKTQCCYFSCQLHLWNIMNVFPLYPFIPAIKEALIIYSTAELSNRINAVSFYSLINHVFSLRQKWWSNIKQNGVKNRALQTGGNFCYLPAITFPTNTQLYSAQTGEIDSLFHHLNSYFRICSAEWNINPDHPQSPNWL